MRIIEISRNFPTTLTELFRVKDFTIRGIVADSENIIDIVLASIAGLNEHAIKLSSTDYAEIVNPGTKKKISITVAKSDDVFKFEIKEI